MLGFKSPKYLIKNNQIQQSFFFKLSVQHNVLKQVKQIMTLSYDHAKASTNLQPIETLSFLELNIIIFI